MRVIALAVFLAITTYGCSILGHLDQALVLNDYGNNKAYQKKIIKINDDHYDALLKAIADDSLKSHKTKADIRRSFGQPLQIKLLEYNTERWLYRYAIHHQAKDKMYLYFIGDQFIRFEQQSNDMMGGEK